MLSNVHRATVQGQSDSHEHKTTSSRQEENRVPQRHGRTPDPLLQTPFTPQRHCEVATRTTLQQPFLRFRSNPVATPPLLDWNSSNEALPQRQSITNPSASQLARQTKPHPPQTPKQNAVNSGLDLDLDITRLQPSSNLAAATESARTPRRYLLLLTRLWIAGSLNSCLSPSGWHLAFLRQVARPFRSQHTSRPSLSPTQRCRQTNIPARGQRQ